MNLSDVNSLPLVSRQLKKVPPQPIGPVNQIQMTDMIQSPLVRAPTTTRHTYQPIIGPFLLLHNPMAPPEHTRELRLERRTIAVVPDA